MQRLYAFTPLRAGGGERVAFLYVGIPSDSAFARVNRIANGALLGFVLVLALALLVTLVASRVLIQHPVDALVRTVRRIGAGDLAARTGLAHTRSEWGRLAAALDDAAERLASREGAAPPRDGP
jgi:HAMP domain-containing protein